LDHRGVWGIHRGGKIKISGSVFRELRTIQMKGRAITTHPINRRMWLTACLMTFLPPLEAKTA
jgi:fatty-acid desaturase